MTGRDGAAKKGVDHPMRLNDFDSESVFVRLQTVLAGRYSLDRELGRGGMGIVYLAREVHLDRLVAIKVLPPALAAKPRTRERFLAEARTAARLSHPHIIPIHAVEAVDEFVFYVMAFVDGETLAQRVSARGPLPAKEGAQLLREVAWALAHAHAQGIVHRDIKPDNILIERDGGRAMVVDFGIASAIGDESAGTHGTPEFMSPEQAMGRIPDVQSDLYALGATAFFAFSGRVPYTGASAAEILARHVGDPVPSLNIVGPTVPRDIVQLVQRCLAKDPTERPADATQIAGQLGKAIAMRRELPAALRAFVKRDGRTDGAGTILTIIGSQIGAIALSNVAGIGAYMAATALSALVAPVCFGVSAAYRLIRRGFTQADLAPAFAAEWETLQEERGVTPRRMFGRLERVSAATARVSATMTVVITGVAIRGFDEHGRTPLFDLALLSAMFTAGVSFGWLLLAYMQRDVDVAFWRRVWTGRFGRVAFAIARRIGARAQTGTAMTHRATELSLSLAAEQLFESLPRETREALRDVPQALAQLQRDSTHLRQRVAQFDEVLASLPPGDTAADVYREQRDAAASRLGAAVGALEVLRLNLLRLHAGTIGAESVTTHIELAVEVGDQVARHVAARDEVDDVFGDVRVAPYAHETATYDGERV